jgi:hypothetical protein
LEDSWQKAEARVGSRIGGRAIERLLGTGTLTSSYVGVTDEGSEEVVRVLHAELCSELWERFGEALAAVPDIAPADTSLTPRVGFEGDTCFATGVLLEGESVESLVARRPGKLAPAECLRICHGAAQVLARSHARGTLHGALHPGHVFVTVDGSVRLLDFSLVELRAEAARISGRRWPR